MARRRIPPTTRAALVALDIASPLHRDLPFVHATCPMCAGLVLQGTSGEKRILRHFACPACGFWMIIEDTQIREAILGSTDPDDGDDTAHGSGCGYVWYNSETGKLVIYADDAVYRRRNEYLARAEARAQGAV